MSAPSPGPALLAAAEAFRLQAGGLRPLDGATGATWAAGGDVLRLVPVARVDAEEAAMAAAAAALPVPRVLGRLDVGTESVLRLERLPGSTVDELLRRRPDLAAMIGETCGAVHVRLAEVPAPVGLRAAAGGAPGDRLLHLDLHPRNLLVDEEGALTGVLDWANAAAGPPALDAARTWSILQLDPVARAATTLHGWRELVDAWSRVGGLDRLLPQERAWSCRYLLADLAHRWPPEELQAARDALAVEWAASEA